MATFVRGALIFFTATCLDENGNPVTPDTATLHLAYTTVSETKATATLTMAIVANVVTATWDSSVADAKPVRWSVRTTGSDAIAMDGEIQLTANESNPMS